MHTFSVGYFDGAAQLNKGGAGLVIYLSETHYFRFAVGCGSSTNTRAELLALWSVLRVCNLIGLPIKMILGDSLVIISWMNRLSTLKLPHLKHWCDEILSMAHLFPSVTYNHIFREHNRLADELSKRALRLEFGSAYFSETYDGEIIGDGYFSLFDK